MITELTETETELKNTTKNMNQQIGYQKYESLKIMSMPPMESVSKDTINENEITDLYPKITSDLLMDIPQNTTSIQLAENEDSKAISIVTEITVNQNKIVTELNINEDKMCTKKDKTLNVTGLPLSQAATNNKLSENQDTSLVISASTATETELPMNQGTTSTKLPVPQDMTVTEKPGDKNTIATNLLVPEDTAASDLPVLNNTPATELPVIQSSTDTELIMNQNATVSELSVPNHTSTKMIVSQDSIVSELPINQVSSATDLTMAASQSTANTVMATSSDNILHLDSPQYLVDKANSYEESIHIDDDRSLDDSHSKESIGIETDVSKGSPNSIVCELCGLTTAIYTCPGCYVKTCSVSCVKEHKRRFFCNGERNKTAFVDTSEYSENHMLNDYRFLEDANRQIYSHKAGAGIKRKNNYGDPNHLTKRCKLLVNAAYKRGVKVQMVAQVLSKHKLNTSYYTIRLDLLSWHIEWLFVASNTVVRDEKVPENTILIDAARKWTNAVNHPELRKALEDYKKENLEKSRFLLKIDCLPANRQRYFEMKPNMSIAENLKGHCLTEFPIIAVLPPHYPKSDDFIIFSSADLLCMDPANRRHVMTNLQGMDFQTELITQLIDPKSHIYSAQPDVIEVDSKSDQ